MAGLDKLEEIIKDTVKNNDSCVFLHPTDKRGYTEDELLALTHRDFETRLLITGTQCAGDCAFLRNHHTDHAPYTSNLNYVRDYVKAFHVTKNWTCAKTMLTTLLTLCFQLSPSRYYTFATSIASGLSKNGANTDFEGSNLADGAGLEMKSHVNLMVTLTVYVIAEFVILVRGEESIKRYMIPLAVTTSLYSFTIAIYNIYEVFTAHRLLYGRIGPLQLMDLIVNAIVPTVLTFTGFVVIAYQSQFIDAVLDSAALLFIPEIDDQLPGILGHRVDDIVKNFLIAESITTFDTIGRLKDEDFTSAELTKRNVKCGVQFSDVYITNLTEQGITNDTLFQPYQVIFNKSGGHQIDPSSIVTVDCLLKKIEWKYTTGYPSTTNPRVGYLRLTKVNGEVIKIVRKEDPFDIVGISDVSNELEGLYIITTFQMSEDVIKLRVCGSLSPLDFLKAFDSYSLWDIDSTAKTKISSLPVPPN